MSYNLNLLDFCLLHSSPRLRCPTCLVWLIRSFMNSVTNMLCLFSQHLGPGVEGGKEFDNILNNYLLFTAGNCIVWLQTVYWRCSSERWGKGWMTGEMFVIIIGPAEKIYWSMKPNVSYGIFQSVRKSRLWDKKYSSALKPPFFIKLLTFLSSITFMLLFNLGTSA